MNNFALRSVLLLVMLPWLGACVSTSCNKPEPFEKAAEGDQLKVPVDLSTPEPSGKLVIPEAARGKKVRGPCGDVPPISRAAKANKDARESGGPVASEGTVGPPPVPDAELPLPTTEVDLLPGAAAPESAGSIEPDLTEPGPIQPGPIQPPLVIGNIESDVRNTIIEWVKVWRAADGPSLLNFYSADFEPSIEGESRAQWATKRVTLLQQTGPADVRYDLLKVRETFAGANARFIQEFHNQGRIDGVVKELDLIVEDGRWKILRERVVEVL